MFDICVLVPWHHKRVLTLGTGMEEEKAKRTVEEQMEEYEEENESESKFALVEPR